MVEVFAEPVHGQADHVVVVALDAGDESAAQGLDSVPSRLVPAGGWQGRIRDTSETVDAISISNQTSETPFGAI